MKVFFFRTSIWRYIIVFVHSMYMLGCFNSNLKKPKLWFKQHNIFIKFKFDCVFLGIL